jgi:hypothetical protein
MISPRLGASLLVVVIVLMASGGCGDDASPHPEGVGNACTKNDDCPTNNCYLGPAGGYCTATCKDEGSTAQCPVDTVCKPIQGGARRCLLVCGSEYYCPKGATCGDDWCPAGSSCTDVSHSSLKGCEPNPS